LEVLVFAAVWSVVAVVLLAGVFEGGAKLAVAVHLDGVDGERHGVQHLFEEARGVVAGGAAVCVGGQVAGGWAYCGEVFHAGAGERHAHVVYLHQFAGRGGVHAVLPSFGMVFERAWAFGFGAAGRLRCWADAPARHGALQYASDGAVAAFKLGHIAAQRRANLALAPQRLRVAQRRRARRGRRLRFSKPRTPCSR